MATDLTTYFRGKVSQEHYSQPLEKSGGGSWVGVFETQTFEFEGLSYALAHTDGEVSCTDVDGTTYTFNLRESYSDSSGGYAFFNKEISRVSRTRMSPHLWRVVFTRTGGKLLFNYGLNKSGPTWMDRYNSAT